MVLYAKDKRVRSGQNCKLEPATYIVYKTLQNDLENISKHAFSETMRVWSCVCGGKKKVKKHWKQFNTGKKRSTNRHIQKRQNNQLRCSNSSSCIVLASLIWSERCSGWYPCCQIQHLSHTLRSEHNIIFFKT